MGQAADADAVIALGGLEAFDSVTVIRAAAATSARSRRSPMDSKWFRSPWSSPPASGELSATRSPVADRRP